MKGHQASFDIPKQSAETKLMETVQWRLYTQHFFLPAWSVYEAKLVLIMSHSLSRSGLALYPGYVVAGKSDHVACVRRGYKWFGYETS